MGRTALMFIFMFIFVSASGGITVWALVGYLIERAAEWTQTDCTAIGVRTLGRESCSIEATGGQAPSRGYTSSYPCVRITVQYQEIGSNLRNATLYSSSAEAGGRCSKTKCSQKEDKNKRVIDDFIREYGSRSSQFTCYYLPDDLTSTILHHSLRKELVLLYCFGSFFGLCIVATSCICLSVKPCCQKNDGEMSNRTTRPSLSRRRGLAGHTTHARSTTHDLPHMLHHQRFTTHDLPYTPHHTLSTTNYISDTPAYNYMG